MNPVKLNLIAPSKPARALSVLTTLDGRFDLKLTLAPQKRLMLLQRLSRLSEKELRNIAHERDAACLNETISKAGLRIVRVGDSLRMMEKSDNNPAKHFIDLIIPERAFVADANGQKVEVLFKNMSLFSSSNETGGTKGPEEFWHVEHEMVEETLPLILFKTTARALPKNWKDHNEMTMEKVWDLYLRYPYNTITYALENRGFMSPFRNIDPDDQIKDWVFLQVGYQRSVKAKFVIMLHSYLRDSDPGVIEHLRNDTSDNQDSENCKLVLSVMTGVEKISKVTDQNEKDLKLAFFFVSMCNAMKMESGLAVAEGRVVNWVKTTSGDKQVDLSDRKFLDQYVMDETTNHLMSESVFLPSLTAQKLTSSQAFAAWQVMRAKGEHLRGHSEFNFDNAEKLCIAALEIDDNDTFDALSVLHETGDRILQLKGFPDVQATLREYIQGSLAEEKLRLLKKLSKRHISVRIALQSAYEIIKDEK